MDFQTKQLLKQCNASSETIEKFKENEIGFKALPYLSENHLNYLFGGKIGKIAEFCGKVSSLEIPVAYSENIPVEQNDYSDSNDPLIHSTDSSSSISSTEGNKLRNSNKSCRKRAQHSSPEGYSSPKTIAQNSDLTEASTLRVEEIPLVSPLDSISILDVDISSLSTGFRQEYLLSTSVSKNGITNENAISSNNSVAKYLKSSVAGRLLQNLVRSQPCDDSARNELADFIVKSEFGDNENKVISPLRFQKLAEEIVELFPSEEKYTYYIPRQKKSDVSEAVNPRGKLYNKYTRFIGLIRKAKLRTERNANPEYYNRVDFQITSSCTVDVSGDLEWLENCMGPQSEAECRWERTAFDRLQRLRVCENNKTSKKKSAVENTKHYFDCYCLLRQPWGYRLLEIDFKFLYSGSELKLVDHWSKISAKLAGLAQIRKIYDDGPLTSTPGGNSKCDETIRVLLTIPKLFKPRPVGKWKPNSLEVSQGFLLHVKNKIELEKYVENLKRKLLISGHSLQPFPVVIGKDMASIDHCYVYIDNFFYSVESPLAAVDTCFKVYHALHISYPCQSLAPWHFLQQAIYGIRTKWDIGIPTVSALVKDYQNLVVL